jgi:peptide methionine sulfoxide reductase MsrB
MLLRRQEPRGHFQVSQKNWQINICMRSQFNLFAKNVIFWLFLGKYNKHYESGTYVCVVCNQELFSSNTKYDSGCGWPAFNDVLDKGKVTLHADPSLGKTVTSKLVNCMSNVNICALTLEIKTIERLNLFLAFNSSVRGRQPWFYRQSKMKPP